MKRDVPKKKDNTERWLLTYSDMITLLLVFFIVMYTLSQIDVKKFTSLSNSLAQALGAGMLDSPGPSVVQGLSGAVPEVAQLTGEANQLENIRRELEKKIVEANLQAKVTAAVEERGLVLSFQDEVLFNLGSADLTPHAVDVIHRIGPILSSVPNYLRVEGHTDDLPINTAQFPSNWELSAARANNVLQELIWNHQISPQRMSAVAYGEYRPVVENSNDANRQANRRVNIVVLRSIYGASEAGASLGEAGPQATEEKEVQQ